MIQFKALLKKELKEAFRDKRALMVAMLLAFMAPLVIFGMSKVAIKEMVAKPPIYVKITGQEFAPKLVEKLAEDNILSFASVPEDDRSLWDERNIMLTIPESFADDMAQGLTIDVVLRADFSEQSLGSPLRRVRNTIRDYSQEIGYKRLLVRGIDVKLLQAVKIVEQDTALPSSNFMMISIMLGMYLLMAAFMSGLSVAIDSSAGERERDVLEILLCQPVSTMKIVLAKLTSASIIALLGVVLTLVLTSLSMSFVDLSKIGASFSLAPMTVMIIVGLLLPICLFASALQLFFSFQAKSFKEAQSSVTMVIMLPVMLPFAMNFMDSKPQWLDFVPVSGQSLIMESIFKGLPVDWHAVVMTTVVTFAAVVVLVIGLTKKLQSEKVIQSLS